MNTGPQAIRDYRRIEAVIRFLEGHAGEQPSLHDAAAAVGLSEFHLQRLFRRWAGVSPKRFVQYLTVQRPRATSTASSGRPPAGGSPSRCSSRGRTFRSRFGERYFKFSPAPRPRTGRSPRRSINPPPPGRWATRRARTPSPISSPATVCCASPVTSAGTGGAARGNRRSSAGKRRARWGEVAAGGLGSKPRPSF